MIDERGGDEVPFHLVPEEEEELLRRIREADAGESVDAWQFLRDLAREKI